MIEDAGRMEQEGRPPICDDLRALVGRVMGCASVFASSDPNEVRCLVEPLRDDDADVQEWLVRRLSGEQMRLSPTDNSTPAVAWDEGSSVEGQQGATNNLEAQLDAILGLPKHQLVDGVEEADEVEMTVMQPTHVFEVLYDDIPRYDATQQSPREILTGLLTKHANPRKQSFGRLRGVVGTESGVELAVFDYEHQSLQDLLKFNTSVLDGDEVQDPAVSDMKRRFLIYQLWELVSFLHRRGLTCNGSLVPSQVWVTNGAWVRLGAVPTALPTEAPSPMHMTNESPTRSVEEVTSRSSTERWCTGDISNFEYLMILNAAAGRRMLDSVFHPVFPWVSDVSSRQGGWRDLSQSKFRLNKGDNQLDRNYESSVVPHHITESLSEITFYIYMARRTPMSVLKKVVRSNFQPKEYPSTIERMFHWTPDECIPEFFSDATVFSSIHGESVMADLALPDWCEDAHDFIQAHRSMLESEEVSSHLHEWIDLNFGASLSGEEAVRKKNVPLKARLGDGEVRKSSGFVQLFNQSHPRRKGRDTELACESTGQGLRNRVSPDTGVSAELSTDASLQSAIQIAEDAMSESSFYSPAEISTQVQLQSILPTTPVSEKKSLSASFVKLKKKHRARPKLNSGGETSPISPPAGRETGQSRSPTVARFAHAIPRFFGGDSPSHHAGVNSDHSTLTTVPTANQGNQTHSSLSATTVAATHDSSRSGFHSRPPSGPIATYTLPPTMLNSSIGAHASPGTHIFRDLWHQLSKPEDEESNDTSDDRNSVSDFDWTGVDFDTIDETSQALLRTGPPIHLEGELGQNTYQELEDASSKTTIHPVYKLPHSWDMTANKEELLPRAEIALGQDIFSMGCLMAEIYTGQPLFSSNSIARYSASYQDEYGPLPSFSRKVIWQQRLALEEQIASIPTDMKSTILDLVNPNCRHRITAWQTRCSPSSELLQRKELPYVADLYYPSSMPLFPKGFQVLHEYFLQYSCAKHWWNRLDVVRRHLPGLLRLPDNSFQIALPSLLSFFKSKSYIDSINSTQVCAATVFMLDAMVRRLGRASARLELLDAVLRVYEKSDLPPVLKLCMTTPDVLKTVVQAFGPFTVLHQFLPAMIDWLTASPGSQSKQDCDSLDEKTAQAPPLFCSESANMLAVSLGELSSTDLLGPAITVKYILPTLLPLLGKVQPRWLRLVDDTTLVRHDTRSTGPLGHASAFGGKNGDGIHVAYAPKQVLYENHYVADTILLICRELPSSVVSESVLPPLCDALPRLLEVSESVSSTRVDGVPDELAREVYVTCRVLRHVIRSVSEQTVQRELLHKRASFFVDILNRLHPPFLHPRMADAVMNTMKRTSRAISSDRPALMRHNSEPVSVSSRRSKQIVDRLLTLQTEKSQDLRAFTAVGVARTVTGALQKVGPEAALGATGILQSIDAFLVRCAAIYSELEVSDFQWRMASEVISEFCSPLRVLLGSEAFGKVLPSVQASSVLQLLLLPNPPTQNKIDQPRPKETKLYLRQTTIATEHALGDEDAAAEQMEVSVLTKNMPELLQSAYRSARLNGVKTASFLHVSLRSGGMWNQDLNESIFLVQEERKRRRTASTANKAGGESAWLRPRVKSYFFARQEDPTRASLSSAPTNSLNEIGRSWSLRGEIRHNIRAHSSSTRAIHVDNDEDLVVSASKNGSCRAWRLASYPSQATGTVHLDSTNLLSARSLEDGRRALATSSTAVHVWDIRTSQVLFRIPFAEEGITSCTPLRILPFKHYQDFAIPARGTSSKEVSALQGNADFAVSTIRKLFLVDARAAPRVVADWRVDARDSTCISATTLITTRSNPVGLIASGTTNGQVFLTDKRVGKCVSHWQALPDGRVIKIVQYTPSYILVVGSDREARVWRIDNEMHPRLRMVVTNVPEGIRETQVSVQAYSDSVLMYVASSAKLYTTRLIHDTSPEARRPDVPTVRLESWSLVDNISAVGGGGPTSSMVGDRGSGANSPDRGRLHRTRMSAQSIAILPLRQVVMIGAEDGSLRTCV